MINQNKMTPKEKAEELFDKINNSKDYDGYCGGCGLVFEQAKDIALIAVDEIMKAPFENTYLELVPDDAPDSDWYWDKFREYWNEVKNEINNI